MTHELPHLRIATGWWLRLVGLIGRTDERSLFLLIPDCSAIHTFGVRAPIDVLFLGPADQILEIRPMLAPRRVCIGPRVARSTLEVPGGYAARMGMQVGDVIART